MGGVTTTFTWDIAGGLPVVLDDGARYVYGAGLVSQVSGANTYYYLADGLGSTMKTVDATGAVVNGYTYDVYGKKTSSTGSQANEFDFAGQQTDPTGLQYLRARYSDPETGTFISREPMEVRPGWTANPFGYAEARPVSLVDPTGLSSSPPNWKCRFVFDDSDPTHGCPNTGIPAECGTAWSEACANDLIGEYVKNTIAGCKADSALCALVVGSQVATTLIGLVVGAAVVGICTGTGGSGCLIAVRVGFGGLHFIAFQVLNQNLGRELRERGKEARGQ